MILLKKQHVQKQCAAIALVTLGIGALGIVDTLINQTTTSFSFELIHPFRLLAYGLVLSLFLSAFFTAHLAELYYEKVIKFVKISHTAFQEFTKILLLTFVSFTILGLALFRLDPIGGERVVLTDDLDWQARVMRIYKVSEVLDQSRAVIDRSVMSKGNKFAVMGLLKESSYLAPYYQSLAKNLNPENYSWEELDSYYVENRLVSREKVPFLMNLLWVNGLFTISQDIPDCEDYNQISTFSTNTALEGYVTRNMYICSYQPTASSNFAEVVYQQPQVVKKDWNSTVEEWWLRNDTQLFTAEEIPFIEQPSDFTLIPQVTFNNNYQSLHISTGITEEVPILLKMSYLPKWKAYDDAGNEIKIYRTSPNIMIVPVKEHVSMYYQMTQLEWGTLLISIVGWIAVFFIPQYGRLKGRIFSLIHSSKK